MALSCVLGILTEMWWVRLVVEFLVLSLAAFRISRFFIQDVLFEPLREKVWGRFSPESSRLGYLFTCFWCFGFWISLVLYFCYTILPVPTLWVAYVFALSAVIGLLSAFEDRL